MDNWSTIFILCFQTLNLENVYKYSEIRWKQGALFKL
jgi:hypothetical protein